MFFWRRVAPQIPEEGLKPTATPGYTRNFRDLNDLVSRGKSFSGYERNPFYLNLKGRGFSETAALLAAPAFAQVADPARAAPRLQALQAAVSPGKQIFIARQLQLTPAEAADFWPVYDAHQAELTRIDVRRGEIRAELATAQRDGTVLNHIGA